MGILLWDRFALGVRSPAEGVVECLRSSSNGFDLRDGAGDEKGS